MQQDDVVYLNEKGAERLKEYSVRVGLRGRVTGVYDDGTLTLRLDSVASLGAFILPLDCVTPAGYAKHDMVEAVQDVVRDHGEELRRLEYGDILIKIQDGRPVFMDITYKSKLK